MLIIAEDGYCEIHALVLAYGISAQSQNPIKIQEICDAKRSLKQLIKKKHVNETLEITLQSFSYHFIYLENFRKERTK